MQGFYFKEGTEACRAHNLTYCWLPVSRCGLLSVKSCNDSDLLWFPWIPCLCWGRTDFWSSASLSGQVLFNLSSLCTCPQAVKGHRTHTCNLAETWRGGAPALSAQAKRSFTDSHSGLLSLYYVPAAVIMKRWLQRGPRAYNPQGAQSLNMLIFLKNHGPRFQSQKEI